MAYFLGRDVDLYITTESKLNSGSNDGGVNFVQVAGDVVKFAHDGTPAVGACIPPLASDAAVLSGSISDTTGIDLSISVSDEDVGPFLGAPQVMQKVELRKETVVTITRKKYNNFWDVIYNGPSTTAEFGGDAIAAKRKGARFGVQFDSTGDKYLLSDGNTFMKDVTEKSDADGCTYGYRLHMVLRNSPDGSSGNTGEIFTLRNAVMTGHSVSLNADGVAEETIEFSSSVQPIVKTPSNTSAASVTTGFDVTLTDTDEL
jgi:hypothetical protein